MAKFLLGIAIIAFTTFIGYVLAKKYRKRKVFFQQLSLFNERFLNEISYYRRPLQAFFSQYTYREEFSALLEQFVLCLNEHRSLAEYLFPASVFDFLKKEEKSVLTDYFQMLGKGDSSSQKTYFSSVKNTLITMEKEAENVCKKYGDLYVKIGFLCGLLILILIL